MVDPDNVVYWYLEKKVESSRSTSGSRWHDKIKAETMSQDFGEDSLLITVCSWLEGTTKEAGVPWRSRRSPRSNFPHLFIKKSLEEYR